MTALPTELVIYLYSVVKDHLKGDALPCMKRMRLVSRQWAVVGERLFDDCERVAARIDSEPKLQSCLGERLLAKYCTVIEFNKGIEATDCTLIRQLIAECAHAQAVSFTCTSTFPRLQPSSEGELFAHIKSLTLTSIENEIPLSHLTSVMSCFPSIDTLNVRVDHLIDDDEDYDCAVTLPNLKRVTAINIDLDTIEEEFPKQPFRRRLLKSTTIRQLKDVTLDNLETMLADESLLTDLGPTLTKLAFIHRYGVLPYGFGGLDLEELAQFPRLNMLDLRDVVDVDMDLAHVLQHIPLSVRVVLVNLSAQDLHIDPEERDDILIPAPHPSGHMRLLVIRVVDHVSRASVQTEEQMTAATDACKGLDDALLACGIQLTFVDGAGQISWNVKVEMDKHGGAFIRLPDLGPLPET